MSNVGGAGVFNPSPNPTQVDSSFHRTSEFENEKAVGVFKSLPLRWAVVIDYLRRVQLAPYMINFNDSYMEDAYVFILKEPKNID